MFAADVLNALHPATVLRAGRLSPDRPHVDQPETKAGLAQSRTGRKLRSRDRFDAGSPTNSLASLDQFAAKIAGAGGPAAKAGQAGLEGCRENLLAVPGLAAAAGATEASDVTGAVLGEFGTSRARGLTES